MLYQDRLYGNIEIDEPVILELIACPTIQRLKKINQAGYYDIFSGHDHSRFSHSVGVCLLLRNNQASLEEQIAGLIHDASHAAFSHAIDYVEELGSEKEQNHQDSIFDSFIRTSEIPKILKKYNIDLDFILDDKNFPLKETRLPDLCADRIDYSIRDAVIFKEIGDAKYFLDNLTVENGRWIFKNLASAKAYADLFLRLNKDYYANILAAANNRTTGDYLNMALAKEYIAKDDLYTTDDEILKKIAPYLRADSELKSLFERMNREIGFKDDPDDYDAVVFCKSRIVDPLCRHEGEIKRVSDLDPEWKETVERESAPKEYHLKFER